MNYKILSVVIFLVATIPAIVFAQNSPPPFGVLVGIPGINPETATFGEYINALYLLSVSIAAMLAVIKIIIAGVKYMLSDVVSSKSQAKSDIQGALLGLLIVIGAVVILETINPQLRVMNMFIMQRAEQVTDVPVRDRTAGPLSTNTDSNVRRVIPCGQNSAGVADCTDAANQCYNDNGQLQQSIRSNTRSITCLFGSTVSLYCSQTMNSATNQLMADCEIARAQCPSGSTYTQTSEYRGTCYTPFPPSAGR